MSEQKRAASRPMTSGETGESSGGPYPNPHQGTKADTKDFKGGQSDQSYYGGRQLGDEELGDNKNATSTEEHQ